MSYKDQVIDLLHSRIDKREELIENSRVIADRILKAEIANAIAEAEKEGTRGIDTLVRALEILADKVAEAMAEVTTAGVHAGAAHAKKLVALNKGSIAEKVIEDGN